MNFPQYGKSAVTNAVSTPLVALCNVLLTVRALGSSCWLIPLVRGPLTPVK